MASKFLKSANRVLSSLQNVSKSISICVRRSSAWTQEGTIKSPYASVDVPNCTLHEYLWQNLEKWPEKTLAVCARTGRGYTYEQVFNLSNTFAANLRNKLKIRDGDTVMIMLPNIPDYTIVIVGILGAGGVVTTINPSFTAYEIQRQMKMCDTKVIVTSPDRVNVVRDAMKMTKINIPIIVVKTNGDPTPEGTVAFNELSEDVHVDKSCLKEVRRAPNDICYLPYSSGTTGLPKGVELTNRSIVTNCEQMNEPLIAYHRMATANHQDVTMALLPFSHIYGSTFLIFHKMTQGLKLVTLDRFQPDLYFESIEKFRINILFLVPPLVLMMTSHPLASHKTLQYVETAMNGAAPLSRSDGERFLDIFKQKIIFSQGYGMTETSPGIAITDKYTDFEKHGYPLPDTELRIVDENMKNLGPYQMGELLVNGPQVMKGYRHNPEANANAFTNDGWFRTGDLAIADKKGIIKVCDRYKELIKVKGFQVPPAELEAVLREHPAISDAAVVGIPHATKGETPKAFVAFKPGQSAPVKDLCAYVAEKVAAYKRIDDISVLESIPRSPSGKILRNDLKSKYC